MSIQRSCNKTYQEVGPLNHTQYLGASVIDFSMNLGWGGESSSCSVNLAMDYSAHPYSNVYDNMGNFLVNQKQNFDNNNAEEQPRKSDALRSDVDYREAGVQDKTYGLQKTILSKDRDKWQQWALEQTQEPNPNRKDLGKKVYDTGEAYKYANGPAYNWLSYDPGFIGDKNTYLGGVDNDIIGCPTWFRYNDVWFGGMIKNWKYADNKYTVELGSFAPLLKGCTLITGKYGGTVSTIIPNTEAALNVSVPARPSKNRAYNHLGEQIALDIAVPFGDVVAAGSPYSSMYNYIKGKYGREPWQSWPVQGNIPNLFNIFGWLENAVARGASGYIEGRGMSAAFIYDTLVTFLSGGVFNRRGVKGPNDGPWSPYGCIVAKTPVTRNHLGKKDEFGNLLLPGMFDPDLSFFTTGKLLPTGRPHPKGEVIRLNQMGLVRAPEAVDGINRSQLRLDLSQVPRPPAGLYIPQDSIDLLSFIDICCQKAGLDFYVDFTPDNALTSYYSGCIKIRTVTRNVQPLPHVIKDFVSNFTRNDSVMEYNYGEEFNDTKTRKVLIGGPQQRMHQFQTHTYSRYVSAARFQPSTGRFATALGAGAFGPSTSAQRANTNQLAESNVLREPDSSNQRTMQGTKFFQNGTAGSIAAQQNDDFFSKTESGREGFTRNRGTYYSSYQPNLTGDTANVSSDQQFASITAAGEDHTKSYPLYRDLISPFFGKSPVTKLPREVWLDRKTNQLQVVCQVEDIQHVFPTPFGVNQNGGWPDVASLASRYLNNSLDLKWTGDSKGYAGFGFFLLNEGEIRSTFGGYEAWQEYSDTMFSFGYPTAFYQIAYDYFARRTNDGFARNLICGNKSNSQNRYDMVQETLASAGVDIKVDGDHQRVAKKGAGVATEKNENGELETKLVNSNASPSNKQSPVVNASDFVMEKTGIEDIKKEYFNFVNSLATQYYGKAVSVRMPHVFYYQDGSGKTKQNLEICDIAYEEDGNMIDDALSVGSAAYKRLTNDAKQIGPIVGFDNTAQYNDDPDPRTAFALRSFASASPALGAYIDNMLGFSRTQADARWQRGAQNNFASNKTIELPNATFQYDLNDSANKQALDALQGTYVDGEIAAVPPAFSDLKNGYPYNRPLPSDSYTSKVYTSVNPLQSDYNQIDPYMFLQTGSPLGVRAAFSTGGTSYVKTQDRSGGDIARRNIFSLAINGSQGVPRAFMTFSRNLIGQDAGSTAMSRLAMSQLNGLPNGGNGYYPRANYPNFIGVPMRNNFMTYGPWVSHPGIIRSAIFPGQNSGGYQGLDWVSVNNLVGGVEVEIDESLVPWEYASMLALDTAALLRVSADANYQQVLEYGSLTLAGIRLNNIVGNSYQLGSRLLSSFGPIITSLNVSLGSSGMTTRYELRTFSRKLGLFNKDAADNIQFFSRKLIEQRRQIQASMQR